MKAYWANLNERERLMVAGGGVFCVIYLLYALIYSPIKSGLSEGALQLSSKQALCEWMRQAKREYHTQNHAQSLSASKLLTVLTTQLNKTTFKHFPYQLQQTGSGDIQLSFESVPYNALLNWIWDMHHQYVIVIKQLNISKTDATGLVKVSILLK